MAVVGVANLAVKVIDLDAAIEFYRRAGADIRDRQQWRNGERADVHLGVLDLTLFTHAIYEPELEVDEGFLHVALFTDDLGREIEGHTVVWGPEVVSGAFGTRRIVFVEAPGGMRLEFMEQLAPPPAEADDPASGSTAAELLRLGAATIGESGGRALAPRIAPVWPGAAVAAPCTTARCTPGDNLAIHAAVAAAPGGRVLVVEVPDEREHGYWGEVLTVTAQARGMRGLIIDACVRDTDALHRRSFPVFATGRALPGAAKVGPGAIDEAVTVGGQRIEPGDWIVADADGIAVVAGADLDAVLAAGRQRFDAEEVFFERLGAGETTVGLLDLDTSSIDGGNR